MRFARKGICNFEFLIRGSKAFRQPALGPYNCQHVLTVISESQLQITHPTANLGSLLLTDDWLKKIEISLPPDNPAHCSQLLQERWFELTSSFSRLRRTLEELLIGRTGNYRYSKASRRGAVPASRKY